MKRFCCCSLHLKVDPCPMAGEEKEDWSSPDSGNQDLREEGFKNDEEAYRDES